ncbi:hypothetical protein ISN44_As06g002380 [Arabidopsis suecica]|uniref:Uncharacterized protein n=1 Tax=Arabidopsis suecica TaxID=45249 RepID=A0A8T2CD64_ARASU|nr:hypothetical protein ISN44_As06g002380 [Arabidopsis suecica]
MNDGCCSKCQVKATKKKKSKKNEDEPDEEDVKQKQKVSKNENPKKDSNGEKGSDEKDKKNKNVLRWPQDSSTKKEKGDGKNLPSEKNGVNPPLPCYTAQPMMYHGGHNPLHRWPISAASRSHYPPFSMGAMHGPYGGCGPCGGPIDPYQSMPRPRMFDGVHISQYPPMAAAYPYMAAAGPFPYWQTRPYMDANPMKRYTTYAENYSYFYS